MKKKFKNGYRNVLKVVVIIVAAFAAARFALFIFDDVLNGSILDWFEKKYMGLYHEYVPYAGQVAYIYRPEFMRLKGLAYRVICIGTIVIALITAAVAAAAAKHKKKKTVTELSRMLHDYMLSDKDINDVFPQEYSEIAAQLSNVKTRMQRHEQILKEETTRKNDLITYLAHDLKTPLTSVIGYLSLISEVPDMPDAQRIKYVNITFDKAKRLETLINEFFDITRYNLQQIRLEKETIDLSYLLVQLTDEFYPLLKKHKNTVALDTDHRIMIHGDAMKLARVFNNILKNAIAYSYMNTEITISAHRAGENVEIRFADHGKTIAPEKLDSIFEKFFRLDEARATNTGGAGLGLAIAKEIVTLHGGTISARSSNEQTEFCVTLPVD